MKTVLICIGNPDGGDDAIGPYIAEQLQTMQTKDLIVLNAETVPENFTGVIKQHQPDHLIIIDAVDMGLQPGEIRIIPKEKIGSMHISTHGIPLSVFINYLEQYIPLILFMGIQPKTMMGNINAIVKKSGDQLVNRIKNNDYRSVPFL